LALPPDCSSRHPSAMGSGCSASKGAASHLAAAPHLAEYFNKLKEKTEMKQKQATEIGCAIMKRSSGLKTGVKSRAEVHRTSHWIASCHNQEMQEWYEKEGKPCLIKSFEHHDKDGSKGLDKEEAKCFFLNLIQETETFTLALVQSMAQTGLQPLVAMMGASFEEKMKAELYKSLATQKKDYDKRIVDYKKNKDAYNEAAFKVMDTSSDGKIQLEEFLEILNPESDKHLALLVALGFMTEQEKLHARADLSSGGRGQHRPASESQMYPA